MRAFSLLGSSSKSLYIPILSALGGVGVRCVETGALRVKSVQHNMGLCCMLSRDGGRGVNSRGQGRP